MSFATTPEEVQELDNAIALDQTHRATLDKEKFNEDERSVWKTVVTDLEQGSSYSRLLEHSAKNVMREEIIVRPMEQLAEGVSEAAIMRIMPNVYRYYKDKCKPLLETLVKKHQSPPNKITKREFQQIISSYKTSSFFGDMLNDTPLSYFKTYQTDEIQKLRELSNTATEYIDKKDIENALTLSNSRLTLFKEANQNTKATTGTDKVIVALSNAFKKNS